MKADTYTPLFKEMCLTDAREFANSGLLDAADLFNDRMFLVWDNIKDLEEYELRNFLFAYDHLSLKNALRLIKYNNIESLESKKLFAYNEEFEYFNEKTFDELVDSL